MAEAEVKDISIAPFKSIEEIDNLILLFVDWPEEQQTELVQRLLSKMTHYQHSQINLYIRPMLQRDFITLLPSKLLIFVCQRMLQCFVFTTQRKAWTM